MSSNNNNNNNNNNHHNNTNTTNNNETQNNEWVNIGLENWKRINKKWRESIAANPTNATPQYKSVDAVTITEEFLNKNGVFSQRVPLPDLVSILSEEWENEEN